MSGSLKNSKSFLSTQSLSSALHTKLFQSDKEIYFHDEKDACIMSGGRECSLIGDGGMDACSKEFCQLSLPDNVPKRPCKRINEERKNYVMKNPFTSSINKKGNGIPLKEINSKKVLSVLVLNNQHQQSSNSINNNLPLNQSNYCSHSDLQKTPASNDLLIERIYMPQRPGDDDDLVNTKPPNTLQLISMSHQRSYNHQAENKQLHADESQIPSNEGCDYPPCSTQQLKAHCLTCSQACMQKPFQQIQHCNNETFCVVCNKQQK